MIRVTVWNNIHDRTDDRVKAISFGDTRYHCPVFK